MTQNTFSRKLPFVIMIVLSLSSLAFFIWKTDKTEEPSPSISSVTVDSIPTPTYKALDTFFNAKLYVDRISLLVNSQREALAKFANEFQIKANVNSKSFLPPVWKKGANTAFVACRVVDFPKQGEIGLMKFLLKYEDNSWHLDLFGSEGTRLFYIINVLDHPLGTLLAFFNVEDTTLRRCYILEDAVSLNRMKVSTAPISNIPWVEDSLKSISKIEFFEKGICKIEATLESYNGKTHLETIIMKSFMRKWFVWRNPAEKTMRALKAIDSIE